MTMSKLETVCFAPRGRRCRTEVLFVHGGYFGAWCWENFQNYLADRGFGSWAVSLRGHAGSPINQSLNSVRLEQYVTDVVQVLDQMETKAVLVGHSMGGGIVQKILDRNPEKTSGAVLISAIPPSGISVKESMAWLKLGLRPMIQLFKLHSGKLTKKDAANFDAFPYGMFFAGNLDKNVLVSYGERMQGESRRVGKQLSRAVIRDPRGTEVPVAVIGGEKDLFFSPAVNLATAEAYGARASIVPGVGHAAMLDQNWTEVADCLVSFLASVEAL